MFKKLKFWWQNFFLFFLIPSPFSQFFNLNAIFDASKVFIHETNQPDFLSAVDEIMKQLKRTGIEINYLKIPYDRKNPQGIQHYSKQQKRERNSWAV